MALYIFENIKSGEIREIFFHMGDRKIYNGEDGTEIGIWERRFTVPEMGVDTKVNHWDSASFCKKTGNMKGTVGDLWTMSAEHSEARKKDTGGIDPIKEKYEKKRNNDILSRRKKQREARAVQSKKDKS